MEFYAGANPVDEGHSVFDCPKYAHIQQQIHSLLYQVRIGVLQSFALTNDAIMDRS